MGFNKRGVELSMTVLIVAILLILVLVILAVFFTGGITNLFGKIKTLYGGQLTDVSAKIASCNSLCQTYTITKSTTYKDQFCNVGTPVDLNGDGTIQPNEQSVTCSDPQLGPGPGVACTAISCS